MIPTSSSSKIMRSPLLASILLLLGTASALSQSCPIVEDINTTPLVFSSAPGAGRAQYLRSDPAFANFAGLAGHNYFVAGTVATGRELFRTDGTASGTTLVADINPGPDDSEITGLIAHNGRLWFFATNGSLGHELWTSDGTPAGTTLVADIYPGKHGAYKYEPDIQYDQIIGLGSRVYFTANDGVIGHELWTSDGTAAGTHLVKEIYAGFGASRPKYFTKTHSGTSILFSAKDGLHGTELWSTDGTHAGTKLVADILAGTVGSDPHQLVLRVGKVYFNSNDGSGRELWVSDGTAAGTTMTADLATWGTQLETNLQHSGEVGGKIVFPAYVSASPFLPDLGMELYSSDGTPGGTGLLLDILPGPGSSYPRAFVAFAGKTYFYADHQLYLTDGTPAGTMPAPVPIDAAPRLEMNGELYAIGAFTQALWKTDGTLAGSSLVTPAIGIPQSSFYPDLTVSSTGTLLFAATDPVLGTELYKSDGTPSGTTLLKDIGLTTQTQSSGVSKLFPVGGEYLLLDADDGIHGKELYRFDSVHGAQLLKDIVPGPASSSFYGFTSAWLQGKQVTLFAAQELDAIRPWITDGTPQGTFRLTSTPCHFQVQFSYLPDSGQVLFAAEDRLLGDELWSTDGTPMGTKILADINPTGSSYVRGMTLYKGELFFGADDGVHGRELWKSDGTPLGTNMVLDINPGASGSNVAPITVFKQKLVLAADNGISGSEMFVSDGTGAGTQLLLDLEPGSGSSSLTFVVNFNNELYFGHSGASTPPALFKTDLTPSGTKHVATLPAVGFDAVASGDSLYFSTGTLWVTDGTTMGTHEVGSITPGVSELAPATFIPASTGVYYSAVGSQGRELYFSDGSASGTALVCDIFPGATSGVSLTGFAPDFTLVDGELYLVATDPLYGTELRHLPLPGAYSHDLGLASDDETIAATPPILGSVLTVTGSAPPAGTVALLGVSGHIGSPSTFALLTAPGSVSWLDLNNALVLTSLPPGSWSHQIPLAVSPALVGAAFNMQAWYLPGGTFPVTTSNGLHLVLGN